MDDIFKTLSHDQMINIEISFSNDEYSTDEALIEFFTNDLGLTKEQAEHALSFRQLYLDHIFASGHSPIFGKDGCLKYEVQSGDFVKFDDF